MTHETRSIQSDTWITPRYIIEALGEFDLDPCTPIEMPWETAKTRYTKKEDGLKSPWFGRVWLNPPYGNALSSWLCKLSLHGNGIALTFARTETEAFFRWCWDKADGIFFLQRRIKFHYPDGRKANTGVAPSVLIAYGMNNAEVLEGCDLPGKYLPINYRQFVVVGVSATWLSVVSIAIRNHGDEDLRAVYEMVERLAPDKVQRNQHWKAKVRQTVQVYRKKINVNHQISTI